MTSYQWGQLGGAFFPTFIMTMILYAGGAAWPMSIRKTISINITSAIICTVLGIIGASISAEQLTFRLVPSYVFAQLFIAVVDIYRVQRALAHIRKAASPRIEPRL
jgi:hypothetical protein